MDLDGDGIRDIITGTWYEKVAINSGPASMYWFKGLPDGRFAGWQYVTNRAGEPIRIDDRNEHGEYPEKGRTCTTPHTVDWDGDGDFDLLSGSGSGGVYLILNEGSAKEPLFATWHTELLADGEPMGSGHGTSGPVTADWDNDGDRDLIVGYGGGGVSWFENIGDNANPQFAKGVQLITSPPYISVEGATVQGKFHTMSTDRAKVCVADYNGDGLLDLLVGQTSYTAKLHEDTPERKAEKEAIEGALKVLRARTDAIEKAHGYAEARANSNGSWTWHDEWVNTLPQAAYEEYAQFSDLQSDLGWIPRMYYGDHTPIGHGNVWVYLRKPAEVQAKR